MPDARSSPPTATLRPLLPALSVALPVVILATTLISILLAVAETFSLTSAQTSTLIVTCYGVSGLLSLSMTAAYRQPLFMIWNSSSLIFLASLAGEYPYTDMMGATFAAGAAVLVLGLLGLSAWLARLIPPAIVLGILAGLVMPFVVRVFTDMDSEPLIVGATVATFILGRRVLPPTIPALLPAALVGFATAALVGDVQGVSTNATLPTVQLLRPTFSWQAILTISPVLIVLIAPLSNLTAVVILRGFRYTPPHRTIDVVTGTATMLSSLFAPVPVAMGNFVTALTAGPDAGKHTRRHWSVYAASGSLVLLAMTASIAVDVLSVIPPELLFAVAGLALVTVFSYALAEVTKGPLRFGPLFAFVVASSRLSLAGFGPAFWALVIGMAVTVVLENREWRALRS